MDRWKDMDEEMQSGGGGCSAAREMDNVGVMQGNEKKLKVAEIFMV